MSSMQLYLKEVVNIQKGLQTLQGTVSRINKEEELFGWDKTSYPDIETLTTDTAPFHHLFEHTLSWQKTESKWLNGPFENLDGDQIQERVDQFWRDTFKTAKQYSASTNMYKICDNIKKSISEFKKKINVITIMCNPGLRTRHWEVLKISLTFSIYH